MMRLRTAGIAIGVSALASLAAAGCSTATDENPDANMAGANMEAENMMAEPANMAAGAGSSAVAQLATPEGADAGTATATEVGGAVQIAIQATGLPAGAHGAHVHTTGKCDAPTFETAGGHWNPTEMQHGTENPQGPHAGDMPNLDIAEDGTGTLTMTLPSGTFAGLLEGDGSAMMIHEGPDDMKTDPSGNSGGRIACGVFAAT